MQKLRVKERQLKVTVKQTKFKDRQLEEVGDTQLKEAEVKIRGLVNISSRTAGEVSHPQLTAQLNLLKSPRLSPVYCCSVANTHVSSRSLA